MSPKKYLSTSHSHVIEFSDLVVVKIESLMMLCERSTSRSREQSTKTQIKQRGHVSLSYSQNNKILWWSNMADICLRNSRGAQRFVGFFLNCSVRVLIGWASNSIISKFGPRDSRRLSHLHFGTAGLFNVLSVSADAIRWTSCGSLRAPFMAFSRSHAVIWPKVPAWELGGDSVSQIAW